MPEDMTEIGFMLVVTVPVHMKAEEVKKELITGIGFGNPCITKVYEKSVLRPVQTVTTTL